MAFICCKENEAQKRTNNMIQLHDILKAVEKEMAVPVRCAPYCVLPVICCQPPEPPCLDQEEECDPDLPDVMVCYKDTDQKKNGTSKKNKRLKKSKSRELRAGILHVGCRCENLDGLQDDCLRTDCRGSPECRTKPPTCGPSEFSNGKHMAKIYQRNGGNADENPSLNYKCYPAKIVP